MNETILKVDIWSDVMCPFCYIGKRRFEHALEKFPDADKVQIEWHSYQLEPDLKTSGKENIYEYLASRKGQSLEWSRQMHEHVVKMAADAGLKYDFDHAVVANSFNAHRLVQLAKEKGVANDVEESLFISYFTEGKDISELEVLVSIGKQAGINEEDILEVFKGNAYAEEVNNDIQDAYNIGVNGVPFFVFNNRYAISGAQPEEYFLQVLNQCMDEQ